MTNARQVKTSFGGADMLRLGRAVVAAASDAVAEPGVVYLVGVGPGDPGLLGLRALTLVASADVVLTDALVHPSVLELCREGAVVEHVGKRGHRPEEKSAKQSAISARLVELAKAGRSVVRLKGGDPYLFGRGSEEAEALVAASVAFEVVPGISAPSASAAYAGMSLTHRDLASAVVFVSGVTRDGQPYDWRELRGFTGTVCVFMGLGRLGSIARSLIDDAGRSGETPVAVVSQGTLPVQRLVRGTLSSFADAAAPAVPTPALIVVGDVAALPDRLAWYERFPLFGKRVLLPRASHQAGSTAAYLRRRGAEPVLLPLIQIDAPPEPNRLAQALRDLATDRYDRVVFTSENGVTKFFEGVASLGLDVRVFGRVRVAAIGTATADSLALRGIVADVVPSSFVGEDLARAILDDISAYPRAHDGPCRVLIPRALVARETVPDMLREAGHQVDVVPVYETVSPDTEDTAALSSRMEQGDIDVVLLTSSSTASRLAALLGEEPGARIPTSTVIASIGPVTTKTAERAGLRVDVTSDVFTLPGLIHAVERHIVSAGVR